MKNVTWTYLGPSGRKSVIDLKHGVTSGNFVLFCNYKVLLIDFGVFENKTYSFFINDELCEIDVNKEVKGYTYGFRIRDDVDTPLNRWKKKMRKKEMRMTTAMIVGMVLSIMITILAVYGCKQYSLTQDLTNHQLVTTATLTLQDHRIGKESYNAVMDYSYRNAKYQFHYTFPKNSFGELIGKNGLPLASGDEFYVSFSSRRPDNHRLEMFRPTLDQVERYRQLVLRKCLETQNTDPAACDCLADVSYSKKGLSGLADMYFMDAAKEENALNNKDTYNEMKKSPGFREDISLCLKN